MVALKMIYEYSPQIIQGFLTWVHRSEFSYSRENTVVGRGNPDPCSKILPLSFTSCARRLKPEAIDP